MSLSASTVAAERSTATRRLSSGLAAAAIASLEVPEDERPHPAHDDPGNARAHQLEDRSNPCHSLSLGGRSTLQDADAAQHPRVHLLAQGWAFGQPRW